jgi:hypothetical protein
MFYILVPNQFERSRGEFVILLSGIWQTFFNKMPYLLSLHKLNEQPNFPDQMANREFHFINEKGRIRGAKKNLHANGGLKNIAYKKTSEFKGFK